METRDNSGVLFHQKEKKSEKAPDYSGEAMVNGEKMKIAGWRKTSSKGTVYLSLSFQSPENAVARKKLEDDLPEDLPF